MNVSVDNLSLALVFGLVLVAISISQKEKLGLTKDIFMAVVRTVLQLIFVGYILKFIFQASNVFLSLAMVLIILYNASVQANKRNPNSKKSLLHPFLALLASTGLTLTILILSGAIQFIPSQVIPISGMLASNAMTAIGLSYRAMYKSFTDNRQQVLEKLSLGATVKLASQDILREAIKTGMQPTIDSAKTVGLVSLPGMMSGLIFAGVDPVHAIRYQIMVMFMLLSATSLASVIASYAAYKTYFTDKAQLEFE
ncbi:ABC transporter permease [Streptococcus suis]|uniref:ABC transporter permease n=1 Tax=Streptococcus suis TaxID=1307 RepID=UPI000CF52609|nr:iron export ABC transporter permease subunit FetB [Streptococcus suis]MCK3881475.1 iron export ABC transporter permease subunit FetB [Streptococcus suis]MCQ8261053.1 iron export ABC transporter permease subunit FetB [Streptococcus suis]NQK44491.1 iron export ABC transporter permease subunit FetB [Streptococcus suis]NRG97313.1 iron export ABC transporter permease subunit FetB [Streptococcus suis]HEM4050633.1 iron export ABC transporter permease subunit FetB [Streptococcus suis]